MDPAFRFTDLVVPDSMIMLEMCPLQREFAMDKMVPANGVLLGDICDMIVIRVEEYPWGKHSVKQGRHLVKNDLRPIWRLKGGSNPWIV